MNQRKRSIGETIRLLREERRLSQSQLADILGCSKSTIAMYETGARLPKTEMIESIADYFNVDMNYLYGKTNTRNSTREGAELSNVVTLPKTGPVIPIKVYGSVPAGIPVEAIEDVVDEIYIPESWTKSGQKFIGLQVKGSSMYPKYLDGDTVVIQLQDDCQSGQDCVVYVNGYEATLKTLYKEADGRIRLQPINPEYQPRYYGPNDDPVKLLGIVKQLIRAI